MRNIAMRTIDSRPAAIVHAALASDVVRTVRMSAHEVLRAAALRSCA